MKKLMKIKMYPGTDVLGVLPAYDATKSEQINY